MNKKYECPICKDNCETKKELLRCLKFHLKDAKNDMKISKIEFLRAEDTVDTIIKQVEDLIKQI